MICRRPRCVHCTHGAENEGGVRWDWAPGLGKAGAGSGSDCTHPHSLLRSALWTCRLLQIACKTGIATAQRLDRRKVDLGVDPVPPKGTNSCTQCRAARHPAGHTPECWRRLAVRASDCPSAPSTHCPDFRAPTYLARRASDRFFHPPSQWPRRCTRWTTHSCSTSGSLCPPPPPSPLSNFGHREGG